MVEKYVKVCLNLDKRDKDGKPELEKIPEDTLTFYSEDIVRFSFSVIENGEEKFLHEFAIWQDGVYLSPEFNEDGTLRFTRREVEKVNQKEVIEK